MNVAVCQSVLHVNVAVCQSVLHVNVAVSECVTCECCCVRVCYM